MHDPCLLIQCRTSCGLDRSLAPHLWANGTRLRHACKQAQKWRRNTVSLLTAREGSGCCSWGFEGDDHADHLATTNATSCLRCLKIGPGAGAGILQVLPLKLINMLRRASANPQVSQPVACTFQSSEVNIMAQRQK